MYMNGLYVKKYVFICFVSLKQADEIKQFIFYSHCLLQSYVHNITNII